MNVLKTTKKQGDYLVVAVSIDAFNEIKGKKYAIPDYERIVIVETIKYVNEVIPENDWEQNIRDLQEHNIDVFVMGNNWTDIFDFLKEYCEVVY